MNQIRKIIIIIAVVVLVTALGYIGYMNITTELNIVSLFLKFPKNITIQETNTSKGCGDIFVYKVNDDDTVGISVSARSNILNLTTIKKSFEIGKTDGLNVELQIRGRKVARTYCTDVGYSNQKKSSRLTGKYGTAIISISNYAELPPGSKKRNPNGYKTTVILKDVSFIDENGNDVDITIGEQIFKDVQVGWYPG